MSDLKGEGIVNYCGRGIKVFLWMYNLFLSDKKKRVLQKFAKFSSHKISRHYSRYIQIWEPQYNNYFAGSTCISESELIATTNEIPTVTLTAHARRGLMRFLL